MSTIFFNALIQKTVKKFKDKSFVVELKKSQFSVCMHQGSLRFGAERVYSSSFSG